MSQCITYIRVQKLIIKFSKYWSCAQFSKNVDFLRLKFLYKKFECVNSHTNMWQVLSGANKKQTGRVRIIYPVITANPCRANYYLYIKLCTTVNFHNFTTMLNVSKWSWILLNVTVCAGIGLSLYFGAFIWFISFFWECIPIAIITKLSVSLSCRYWVKEHALEIPNPDCISKSGRWSDHIYRQFKIYSPKQQQHVGTKVVSKVIVKKFKTARLIDRSNTRVGLQKLWPYLNGYDSMVAQ